MRPKSTYIRCSAFSYILTRTEGILFDLATAGYLPNLYGYALAEYLLADAPLTQEEVSIIRQYLFEVDYF